MDIASCGLCDFILGRNHWKLIFREAAHVGWEELELSR